ncbi:MAG TPA: hypoxanthine phosphoribosyltransferase [Planctomycetota bacterium]|nr:hypoxanthine phosphoribosyltransferase [Planctomycetota bacterium]
MSGAENTIVMKQPASLPKGGVLIENKAIERRIQKLGSDIDWYCREQSIKEIHAVAVLTGAVIFAADLIRCIQTPLNLSFVKASSYDGTTRTEDVKFKLLEDLPKDVWTDRPILLIEDIYDSGHTMAALFKEFQDRGAKTILTCVLLKKTKERNEDFPLTFVGFQIPDQFVVGYGLDCDGKYRQLKDIVVLESK